MSRIHTPSQTVGPFFHLGLGHLDMNSLAPPGTPADEVIAIRGRVYDADLNPVPDAQLEIWQANARGEYFDANIARSSAAHVFTGFGRIPTNEAGEFHFTTIKPGATLARQGDRAQSPHIVVTILMRGLLRHLFTRIYFPNDPRNDADPVLQKVTADRRATLVAQNTASNPNHYEWNVVLQGENETVFFDL